MPPYVFEFDRNLIRKADGTTVEHDYTCKACGEEFANLAALGSHTNSAHKGEHQEPDDEPIVVDRRGKKKGRTFTCREPGCEHVSSNLYAHLKHLEAHRQVTETVDEPVAQ